MVPAKLRPLTSPKRGTSKFAASVEFLICLWRGYEPSAYTFIYLAPVEPEYEVVDQVARIEMEADNDPA